MKKIIYHIIFWTLLFGLLILSLSIMGLAGTISNYGWSEYWIKAKLLFIPAPIAGVIMGVVDYKTSKH